MSYRPQSFADACGYLVRYLVRSAYGMAANSVRPANQAYPTGNDVTEFATVKIIAGPTADFGAWAKVWSDDPTANSTKVVEDVQAVYRFDAAIQFFRHANPAPDTAGLPAFGLGALDRAARLETILSSSPMMDLMERMGLGLESSGGQPVDVSALVESSRWEDRASVTLSFVIVNREQFLIESFAQAGITVEIQRPGAPQLQTETIEVTQ